MAIIMEVPGIRLETGLEAERGTRPGIVRRWG